MPFADYTTPADVRSILGISDQEIEDEAIANNIYLTGMIEAMHRINPSLAADYLTIKALTGRNAAQNRFMLLAGTYCAYTAALQLIPNMPLSAPKDITDGKSATARIDNPYEKLIPQISGSLSYFRDGLVDAYKIVFPDAVLSAKLERINIVSTGVGFDPVTGA